jgi:hypothetical protein
VHRRTKKCARRRVRISKAYTNNKQTKIRKKNKMAQKKAKKNVKVRDLKPTKDAKGGGPIKPRPN